MCCAYTLQPILDTNFHEDVWHEGSLVARSLFYFWKEKREMFYLRQRFQAKFTEVDYTVCSHTENWLKRVLSLFLHSQSCTGQTQTQGTDLGVVMVLSFSALLLTLNLPRIQIFFSDHAFFIRQWRCVFAPPFPSVWRRHVSCPSTTLRGRADTDLHPAETVNTTEAEKNKTARGQRIGFCKCSNPQSVCGGVFCSTLTLPAHPPFTPPPSMCIQPPLAAWKSK